MDGVAATASTWLDASGDRVPVRAPLTARLGGLGPGEVVAIGQDRARAGEPTGGAVDDDDVADRTARDLRPLLPSRHP